MNLRRATEADEPVLRELWEEFEAEIPSPPEFVETWEEEWRDVAADIAGRGAVYLAEDKQGVAYERFETLHDVAERLVESKSRDRP